MALTREQMAAAISAGRSVLWNGRLITRIENLPSKADLATTEEEIAAAEAEAEALAKKAEEQKAKIAEKKSAKAGEKEAKKEAKK